MNIFEFDVCLFRLHSFLLLSHRPHCIFDQKDTQQNCIHQLKYSGPIPFQPKNGAVHIHSAQICALKAMHIAYSCQIMKIIVKFQGGILRDGGGKKGYFNAYKLYLSVSSSKIFTHNSTHTAHATSIFGTPQSNFLEFPNGPRNAEKYTLESFSIK